MSATNFYDWLQAHRYGAAAMDARPVMRRHADGTPCEARSIETCPKVRRETSAEMLNPNESGHGRGILKQLYVDENGNPTDHKYSPFLKRQGGDGGISRELDDILERLFGGEEVPDSEIEATPEWAKAMRVEREAAAALKEKYGVEKTSGIDTPDRQRFRSRIVEAALAENLTKAAKIDGFDGCEFETNEALKPGESYKVAQDRVAVVAIGFPAAGKSTTYANPLARKFKARLCDSDAIKKALPEFDHGYGGNLVHDESTRLNEEVLAKAVERGDNVIYPILGFKADKLGDVISKFREKGYRVALCFKDMPVNIAKGRLLVRFLQKGRYLPLRCVSKAVSGLAGSFEANKGKADSFVRSTSGTTYPPVETVLEKSGTLLD